MLSLIAGTPALALYAPTDWHLLSSHLALSITSDLYPSELTSTASCSSRPGFSSKLATCLKKVMGFWSSCCGFPMLAEMTSSKGRSLSPAASLARYISDLTASSPLTAYSAATTFWLMLPMLSRGAGVDADGMAAWCCWRWEAAAGRTREERGVRLRIRKLVMGAGVERGLKWWGSPLGRRLAQDPLMSLEDMAG